VLEVGLKGMGDFGTTEGHIDRLDSIGALTTMISNSRVPNDYEAGRFHLLWLGCYIVLTPFKIVSFCGLNRHGGTPPIAPPGTTPLNHAYRLMIVLYPPQSMISQAGRLVLPLASLPCNKLLSLGPEVTSHRYPSMT
jgi:hypothetical protein